MELMTNRLAWRIGGAQGSGVDTAANLFARAMAFGGLHVFGNREYYSNIMGEHSYFELRVSETPVACPTTRLNVLATFDAETAIRHSNEIEPDGALIYDVNLIETAFKKIPSLEHRVQQDLGAVLDEKGLPHTMNSMLQLAEKRGVTLYPIPYEDLLRSDEALEKLPFATLKRMVNTMSAAASAALLDYDLKYLNQALEVVFVGKQKVIDLNVRASEVVYDYFKKTFTEPFSRKIEPLDINEKRIYVNGNQAVGMGKLAAGCSVQTYYPISPATDESTFLEEHESFPLTNGGGKGSILVLQTGDEIAAICSAIGAGLSGARAATSTSGPGFSLMAEALGWAGINESPVVVTLYQRGGPSTGLPTRTEQGDLRFALHAGHGEFPRLVLASGDLEESFYDSMRVFNYAEKYQTPVIHLMDKGMASYGRTFTYFDVNRVKIERGELLSDEEAAKLESYDRFAYTESNISPRTVLGQKGGVSWYTGDESTEDGHITEDPVDRVRMMEKRAKKLDLALKEIPQDEQYALHGDPNATTTIVSWGSPKGSILEAMERLTEAGHAVNFLQGRLMSPFPVQAFTDILQKAERLIGIEENYSGQFGQLVREHTGVAMDHFISKFNGRPITVDEVEQAVVDILQGKVSGKVVLQHGI